MDNKRKETIDKLTIKEKAQLLSGITNMETYPVERLNISSLTFSDGPSGLRKEGANTDGVTAMASTSPATCFPTEIAIANSWNKENALLMGTVIGKECIHYGVNVLLAPAVNIQRNPLGGRNFEYYSEDPFITGVLASNFITGVQSNKVGTCIKHYAVNNLELYRMMGDSVVDKRALHEIYLKAFEMAIKQSHPYSVMSSYNKINGVHASENKYLLKEVLKGKWNYDGLVMTDWGGMVHKDLAIKNGNDLEMPGQINYNISLTMKAVKDGTLSLEELNDSVDRYLLLHERTTSFTRQDCDFKKHIESALEVASDCIVLLKNEDKILPLKKDKKYLVIGEMFAKIRYQGSGSSMINPYKLITHEDAFKSNNVEYEFVKGYKINEVEIDETLINEAIEKANNYEDIILYIGQTDWFESEGFDRANMQLNENQLALVDKLKSLNKNIVCVLSGGSQIEMPFENSLKAILDISLLGQCAGLATYKALFGEISPSGRLAQTWPYKYEDVPFGNEFSKGFIEKYKESIFVGYRYYNTFGIEVRYPFGYGLSYSSFKYGKLKVQKNDNEVRINVEVTNIGEYDASEVIQVYISCPGKDIIRPAKELKAFEKVFLKKEETKLVPLKIEIQDLAYFSETLDDFKVENGKYKVYIGKNVNENILEGEFEIKGQPEVQEKNPLAEIIAKGLFKEMADADFEKLILRSVPTDETFKFPYTMETPIKEFNTFWGKRIKKMIYNIAYKEYKKGLKMQDGPQKEIQMKAGMFMSKIALYNSLRSLCFASSGRLSYNMALGLLYIANRKVFKGLSIMMRKDKLPKE